MRAFRNRASVVARVAGIGAATALAAGVAVASPGSASASAASGDGGRCRPVTGATAQDVGTLGGPSTYAADMNDDGVVVGVSDTDIPAPTTVSHAFRWHRGVMTDLTPAAEYGIAIDVNDRGEVLFRGNAEGAETMALWSRRGVTELPGLAYALNDRGEALLDNAVWRRGSVAAVASPDAGHWVSSIGLGEGGHVYGVTVPIAEPGGGHPSPDGSFVWRDGTSTAIDVAPYGGALPVGIDRSGRLLVQGTTAGGGTRALLADAEGYVVLPSLTGAAGDATSAAAIDDRGDAVGWSVTASGARHAVLWRDGQVVDLHGPGIASEAAAIGPRGHVAGTYVTEDGATRLFLAWCGRTTDLGIDVVAGAVTSVDARGQVLVDTRVVTPTYGRT